MTNGDQNPFSFLEGRKLKELCDVLALEAPADLAWITLGRSATEARQFLRLLPLPLQESIWIARAHWKELSPENQILRAHEYADRLFLELENRKNGTVKNLDSALLDPELKAARILQNALLEYLSKQSPDLAESLRSSDAR